MSKIYLTFLTFLWISCSQKEQDSKKEQHEELVAVTGVYPEMKNLTDQIEASGTLSSKSELKLAFKTGGLIKRLYVSEGQTVNQGQLLAELDLSEIDAQVNQAKLSLEKSKRDFEKVKGLFADELATQSNLDDAETAFDVAKQSVQTAVFNQKLSKIYAPQSGKILKKLYDQGELITPFMPALILGTGNAQFAVNIGLVDKDIVKLNLGNRAEIELDAYPGERFPAKITQISQMVNPATGTYEVELEINSSGKKLISGFVARAFFIPQNTNSVLSIPIESLVEANANKAKVFVIAANKVSKKEVLLGKIIGSTVEIINGISTTDQIVLRGANFLSDGQKIKLIP